MERAIVSPNRPSSRVVAWGSFTAVLGLVACEPRAFHKAAPPEPEAVEFVAVSDVRRVAVGWNDICVALRDGSVRCKQDWRPAGERRLGSFLAIPGAADVADLATGYHHSCARNKAGAVLCWGRNDSGEVGGTEPIVRVARAVKLPGPAAEVRVGETQSCARLVAGAVMCWGKVAGTAHAPPTDLGWFANAAGLSLSIDALCAHSAEGALSCSFGGGLRLEPVAAEASVRQVVLGRWRGCVLVADGSVQCFALERPKDAPVTGKVSPWAEPIAGLTDVVQLAAGTAHTCARRKDASVWCWGANEHGQLGDGSRVGSNSPVRVARLTDAVEIAAGGDRSCAVRGSESIVCWGSDLLGDAMYRGLTGLAEPDPGPPGPNDSLVPETLRVPVFSGSPVIH